MVAGSRVLTLVQRLKISLFARGIRLDGEAQDELSHHGTVPLTLHEYATTGGVTLRLGDDVFVNAPFDEWWCDRAEATLTFDRRAEHFLIQFDGEELPVAAIPLPGYLHAVDDHGRSVTEVVMSHCDRARVSPIVGCALDCQFCDLAGMKYVRRPPEQLLAALRVAFDDPVLPVRHVLISGGTPGPKDFGYYDDACRAVVGAFSCPVDVMMVPRRDPSWIANLVSHGLHGFAINTEVFGDAEAERIIRLKHRLGLAVLAENIEEAVRQTGGQGRVRSLILVGLEPLESTLEGIEFLARLGCDPVLSPFRPAIGTKLATAEPPSEELLERVYLEALEIVERYGVKLGPRCIPCQHNTLAFPDGTDAYSFT